MPLKPNNNGFEYILNELYFYLFEMDFGNFGRFSVATCAVRHKCSLHSSSKHERYNAKNQPTQLVYFRCIYDFIMQKYFNPKCRCFVFKVNLLWIDVCLQHYPCGRCNKWFRRTFGRIHMSKVQILKINISIESFNIKPIQQYIRLIDEVYSF